MKIRNQKAASKSGGIRAARLWRLSELSIPRFLALYSSGGTSGCQKRMSSTTRTSEAERFHTWWCNPHRGCELKPEPWESRRAGRPGAELTQGRRPCFHRGARLVLEGVVEDQQLA